MTEEERPRPRPRPAQAPPGTPPPPPPPIAPPPAALEPVSTSKTAVDDDDADPTAVETDEVDAVDAVDDSDSATPPRRNLAHLAWAAVGVVLVLALVAVNIWLYVIRSGNDSVEQARHDASASAKKRVPAMLSYNYKSVAAFATSAPKNATGAFKKDFATLIKTVIAPAAKQQQITTRAQVKSVGVVEAHESKVVVLVLLNQTTSSKSIKTPRLDGSRLRVTMRPSGGKWLVSELTPI